MQPPLGLLTGAGFATRTDVIDREPEAEPLTAPGIIREHLMDFGSKLNDDQKLAFAEFTGAHLQGTVFKWFKGAYEPSGVYELKARILLDHLGYKFPEHERMDPDVYQFSRHIGFNLCTVEEAEKLLGVSRVTMMRVLSGRNGTSKERVELIKLYVEENAPALAKAIEDLPDFPRADPSPEGQGEPTPEPKGISQSVSAVLTGSAGLDKNQLKDVAIGLMRALGPVAKLLASDAFTPEDREEVRGELGKYGVFDLKNDLIKLCGERARTTITAENK